MDSHRRLRMKFIWKIIASEKWCLNATKQHICLEIGHIVIMVTRQQLIHSTNVLCVILNTLFPKARLMSVNIYHRWFLVEMSHESHENMTHDGIFFSTQTFPRKCIHWRTLPPNVLIDVYLIQFVTNNDYFSVSNEQTIRHKPGPIKR